MFLDSALCCPVVGDSRATCRGDAGPLVLGLFGLRFSETKRLGSRVDGLVLGFFPGDEASPLQKACGSCVTKSS